jgi:hypothetical protein
MRSVGKSSTNIRTDIGVLLVRRDASCGHVGQLPEANREPMICALNPSDFHDDFEVSIFSHNCP